MDKYIDLAMKHLIAIENTSVGSKHVTFITKRNKIISIGINRNFETHPLAAKFGYRFSSIHSELDAVLKIKDKSKLERCNLINVRLSTDSFKYGYPILRMSKPCEICLGWILAMNFKHIYFTTNNNNFERLY